MSAMARKRSGGPGVSVATLDIAWMVAAAVAVLAPVVGIAFGLYFMLKRTLVFSSEYKSDGTYYSNGFAWQHSTLALGVAVILVGLLLGAVAAVVAVSVRHQVAPLLHAQRLADARAIADEQR